MVLAWFETMHSKLFYRLLLSCKRFDIHLFLISPPCDSVKCQLITAKFVTFLYKFCIIGNRIQYIMFYITNYLFKQHIVQCTMYITPKILAIFIKTKYNFNRSNSLFFFKENKSENLLKTLVTPSLYMAELILWGCILWGCIDRGLASGQYSNNPFYILQLWPTGHSYTNCIHCTVYTIGP